jgi:lipid-A-disaccharide synthase
MAPSVFISAGEASGEQYGALLANELIHKLGHDVELFGMGGPKMEAAGVECVVRSEDVAVMGLTEVLSHLPGIWREFQKLKQALRQRRPAVAVLIDFPGFHFRLARELHKLGIPVIYFVGPQLWAWKAHRIKLVRKYVRQMLVIFPFEEPYYRERGVAASFVGHPLAELPPPAINRQDFAARSGLDPEKIWIGLLPGSRLKEIEANLPEILRAAKLLHQQSTDREFVLPLAATLDAARRTRVLLLVEQFGGGLPVRLVDDARATLFHARASVVASGTATVEAALVGNPFVVVYRVSAVTYAIARQIVKVQHVAMANLIAGKEAVPELIQHDFTAEKIVQHLETLLPDGSTRESMKEELAAIRQALGGGGAIARVAEFVTRELHLSSPAAVAASQP